MDAILGNPASPIGIDFGQNWAEHHRQKPSTESNWRNTLLVRRGRHHGLCEFRVTRFKVDDHMLLFTRSRHCHTVFLLFSPSFNHIGSDQLQHPRVSHGASMSFTQQNLWTQGDIIPPCLTMDFSLVCRAQLMMVHVYPTPLRRMPLSLITGFTEHWEEFFLLAFSIMSSLSKIKLTLWSYFTFIYCVLAQDWRNQVGWLFFKDYLISEDFCQDLLIIDNALYAR